MLSWEYLQPNWDVEIVDKTQWAQETIKYDICQ